MHVLSHTHHVTLSSRRLEMRRLPSLPHELWIDILSRVPVVDMTLQEDVEEHQRETVVVGEVVGSVKREVDGDEDGDDDDSHDVREGHDHDDDGDDDDDDDDYNDNTSQDLSGVGAGEFHMSTYSGVDVDSCEEVFREDAAGAFVVNPDLGVDILDMMAYNASTIDIREVLSREFSRE